MQRLSRLLFMVLGFFLVAPALYAQDDEDPEGPEVEQSQEREARRAERQRQIGSLSDEQRQALRERRRIREGSGAGQRGQRPPRRRPPASPPAGSAELENEESP
ncbi:MAG: hypothetical protein O3C29_04065 [Proteobacteria bacterium]|jgi:hypothetical protein|nr:hypothetical protein [Pseudomonadota bacterium]MDA1289645.1 hypothetical protein [Pseudomonadota bacterium]